ncbi:MAG: endonuclease [Gammaproteobacteria bacterium]|nr:endonuclease [Gammaproteobacteria bacterium]MCK5091160.1 endonuclease [Gammaproteobacteria bacterium]
MSMKVSPLRLSKRKLKNTYHNLYKGYGRQDWWPGDTPFEIMVGAILTQNTAWTNVEKAITNLKVEKMLSARKITGARQNTLARLLKPSGYFNIKAKRLKNFCSWYLDQGGFKELAKKNTDELRSALLTVNGVGHETADDILLYAFERPVFVIDAYTRRIFSRLGLIAGDEPYDKLREAIELALKQDTVLFNEYHALIVNHGKDICRVKPKCMDCVLNQDCLFRRTSGQIG